MKLKDMYTFVKKDLQSIEAELERSVSSAHPLLQQSGTDLLKAGGKRIRPVFVLLSAQYGDYDADKVKKAAAALELIHMASLVHDDVVDDADIRRGRRTIKSQYDDKIAMYVGDFIFARALQLMSEIREPAAHQILAEGIREMCLGEIQQIKEQFDTEQNVRQYLRRIKRKTALLIAMSCQLGAIASGAPVSVQRNLYEFGYNAGMAFQLTDDILDFTSTEKELGKPAGGDLKQGNLTLPALYAMYKVPGLKEKIMDYYAGKGELKPLLAAVKESGAIEFSAKASAAYLEKAVVAANMLPNHAARTSLLKIAGYIGRRKF
ncbi:heptaprenyl diphosphate synthase component II [Fictibacillus aquaticus]|uniref:Heptaprenyl diphosphate synthase component II n=1 Tax=Fictibacillus aquaticus TaxID=2021314 RepID=A0A235FCK4_9BACL|nr:heptaprenyl diphosphate synthase component II [Fictibacillus aquaticus]OYD58525.1 heptaprenyl diphosphate synthase component II [Fictibacillus aquaticus]